MANIYSLDTARNLILYPSGHQIFLGTSNGKTFTRAVSLCNDYSEKLSDVVYNGTLYFSYQNSNHDIILRNITDTEPIFQISQQDIPDCFLGKLVVFQENLLLFYFVKNPLDDTYLLKGVFPEQKNITLKISAVFPEEPVIHPIFQNHRLLLCITTSERIDFWQIDENRISTPLFLITNAHTQKIDTLTKNQQQQEERIMQYQKEISQLSAQASRLRQDLIQRDAMIESAKRQYNELMDTAIKYREEAIKWRSKFQ